MNRYVIPVTLQVSICRIDDVSRRSLLRREFPEFTGTLSSGWRILVIYMAFITDILMAEKTGDKGSLYPQSVLTYTMITGFHGCAHTDTCTRIRFILGIETYTDL